METKIKRNRSTQTYHEEAMREKGKEEEARSWIESKETGTNIAMWMKQQWKRWQIEKKSGRNCGTEMEKLGFGEGRRGFRWWRQWKSVEGRLSWSNGQNLFFLFFSLLVMLFSNDRVRRTWNFGKFGKGWIELDYKPNREIWIFKILTTLSISDNNKMVPSFLQFSHCDAIQPHPPMPFPPASIPFLI